jgi:hypothetical protein
MSCRRSFQFLKMMAFCSIEYFYVVFEVSMSCWRFSVLKNDGVLLVRRFLPGE